MNSHSLPWEMNASMCVGGRGGEERWGQSGSNDGCFGRCVYKVAMQVKT